MKELFEAARRVSVPILVVQTADQSATVAKIAAWCEGAPVFAWDAAVGVAGVNPAGAAAAKKASLGGESTFGFVDALVKAADLPQGAVLCMRNAHRQLQSAEPGATAAAVQAVSNLRDRYKLNFRTLVLLCPGMVVPVELDQDVVVLRDPLPGRDVLAKLAREIQESAKRSAPATMTDLTPEKLAKAVEAVSGLSEFAAEQVLAMSYTATGIDLDAVWERKRTQIEQTQGLHVYRGKERFADVVGCESVKARLRQRITGRVPVGVVVLLDEIDKVLANVEQDTSGVRMDQLRTLLTTMEDHEWEGILEAGVPGGGKTLLAKAFANEAGVPLIMLDLAGMEGSLVGESEARLRQAVAVIEAVGDGHAYVVATSNNATVMRPELQRRLCGGFFFFDLMSDAERAAAVAYYMRKYELPTQPLPDMTGWTAAEVRNCMREAWNSRVPVVDAARFIIPVAQARADEFDAMRRYASGRYLDANRPGAYHYSSEPMERHVRAISLGDVVTAAALSGMKES